MISSSESSNQPSVTICIPSFNREDLVGETLESLLAQTLPEWEAIVVDDGSTDAAMAVVSEYARRDSRIRLLERGRGPKGACTCRNIAAEHAHGRYVLFLDNDDLLAPFALAQRVQVLDDDAGLDFAIFSMLLFRGEPGTADRLWNIDTGEDDLLRLLRLDPICQGTGTLWRRESFARVGSWDETLRVWQDIEFHLRAFTARCRYKKRLDLPPDVYLRETDSSLSRGGYQSREKLESRALVARSAVALLRERGRAHLVPHVRYFCSSVVLGAAASNNLDIAREMRSWGVREGVLTRSDARRLRFAEVARRSRLDRLELVRRVRDDLARSFHAPSTLGQVRSSAWKRSS
ncbi:MAG: glycosyltransferase family 2 protein [Gemmatimonadaceae bacterium]